MSSQCVKGKLIVTLRAEYEVVIDDPNDLIRKEIQDTDGTIESWNCSVRAVHDLCEIAMIKHEEGLSKQVDIIPISIEGYACSIDLEGYTYGSKR